MIDTTKSPTRPSRPDNADALFREGVVLYRKGRLEPATACLRRALEIDPTQAEVQNNLGVVLADLDRHEEALACFEEAVRLQPGYAQAHHNRGNALRRLGKLMEAAAAYEQALRLNPEAADSFNNLGITLLALRCPADAVNRFRQALRCRPDHAEAYNNLGVALAEQGSLEEAAAIYRQVLRRKPRAAETHNNLGVALAGQGRSAEAIPCYEQALRLRPAYPEAYNNLGNALRHEGRLEEAVRALAEALRLEPTYAEAHNNRAIVLVKQGNMEGAVAAYDEAIRLKPDYADAYTNRALARLIRGDFTRGWAEYEWRWRTKDFKLRHFEQPRWDGENLDGRTLLLYAEQGLGDTIQFVRYALLAKERGGTVLLEAPPALLPLLESCPGIDRLLPAGVPLPEFDVQAPLLSMPALFGTTLERVPATVPYLSAQPERLQRWGERLRALPGLKVGIAWQGNPKYRDDRLRSIPLKHFTALARLPGVKLVSLQKWFGAEQLAAVGKQWDVLDLAPELDEGGAFLDTAAVIQQLDLVVTSDTALAHLAGALAAPVWLALPCACDWRWLLERADCPWYPTMRLFRQLRWGDWEDVFQRIADEIRKQQPTEVIRKQADGSPDAAALRRFGNGLYKEGRLAEAIGCLRQALLLEPDSAPGHNNLGVVLAKQGQLAEAVAAYEHALRLRPDYAEAVHNLGEALQRQGKLAEALACYDKAAQLAPDVALIHHNKGLALAGLNRLDEACVCYREALRLLPGMAQAHRNLADVLEKQGQFEEAVKHYEQALQGQYAHVSACVTAGKECAGQGRLAEAAACFCLALRREPACVEAAHRLALILARRGKHEEAVPFYEQALRRCPENADVHHDLGNSLRQLGRLIETEAHYRQALRLRPAWADLSNRLGIVLIDQGKPAEAERSFRDAIRARPDHPQAHNNLGVALEQLGRVDEAVRAYQESIRLEPEAPDTHKNLALAWLLSGNFEQGWVEYEWRWKCAKNQGRRFEQPRWDGKNLEGRTLLLFAEQGLGDTIQFVRYARLAKERGGTVLLEAPPALLPLLERCPGIDRLLPAGSPLPAFDVQAPLLSMPALFGTTLEHVPATVPYLSAQPERLQRWGERLRGLPGLKVGIAWQGNPKYQGDRQRSIPLKHFAALARVPGVQMVSLQKGFGAEQLREVGQEWGVVDLAPELDEGGAFLDTAAVVQQLDLVVTSDTALAHLAGALAAPVWLLLPYARDWRWLMERVDCPWYPTMRLFRQRRWGDWEDVFQRIADELEGRVPSACLRRPLQVEMAPAELLDRIAALEAERERAIDTAQRLRAFVELGILVAARARSLVEPLALRPLLAELRTIHTHLRQAEETMRHCAERAEFGAAFEDAARTFAQCGARRLQLRREIDAVIPHSVRA